MDDVRLMSPPPLTLNAASEQPPALLRAPTAVKCLGLSKTIARVTLPSADDMNTY